MISWKSSIRILKCEICIAEDKKPFEFNTLELYVKPIQDV